MYDELNKKMKPVMDMAEINRKTAEKLISLQSAYVSNFINSSLAQMKTLASIQDPKTAIEAQIQYLKSLEAQISDVAQKEVSALSEAKAQLIVLMEKTLKEIGDAASVAELEKMLQGFTGKK